MSEKKKVTEKDTLKYLRSMYDTALSYYGKEQERIRILDMVDNGQLWKALNAKLPPYQICPDTNHVSYVKSNLVASLYTVAKSATVLPTSDEDKSLVMHINLALEQLWQTQHVATYQQEAGEWAALVNLGITQVGWDDNTVLSESAKHFVKGSVVFENIDPIKFMRDPFAKDLDSAAYCMTYDVFHKSVFLNAKIYRDSFKEYLNDCQINKNIQKGRPIFTVPALRDSYPASAGEHYFTLLKFWIKNDEGGIDEIHTVNLEKILYRKNNIKPNVYPFALLYCNSPRGGRPIGLSEPARIFANSVAYNILDSISLTADYRNQRPPKFVDARSGLNINAFAKHADDPDHVFVVSGDATKAVHYHEYPQVSNNANNQQIRTQDAIKLISGVDDRYTGRDTGSIITTGGTEEMLNRVTIIDTPKINNYENYTTRLTELVLLNMLNYSSKRKYFVKKEGTTSQYDTFEIDFPKIPSDTLFSYQIIISSDLPKNKQRIAALATTLMEKQMQYGSAGNQNIQLITPEEWLEMQDIPGKERFLERMGIQRNTDAVEETTATLFNYAELVQQGMQPDQAILATAKRMQDARSGNAPLEQQAAPMGAPLGDMPTGGGGAISPDMLANFIE